MDKEKSVLPPIIKRNVFLFTVAFSCLLIGFECGLPICSKIALELTGKKELIGLPLSLLGLAGVLIAIPIGKISDKIGRKPCAIFSILVMGGGLIFTAWAVYIGSWAMYLLGYIIIGLGLGGNFLFELSVFDMFPPNRKGEAAGFVFLGMYFGFLMGPFLGGVIADHYGFIATFLLASLFEVVGLVCLCMVHSDPLKIGINIGKYYPNLKTINSSENKKELKTRRLSEIFRLYPIQVQFWSRVFVHGPRLFLLVLTPVILTSCGYNMTWIGFLLMIMGTGTIVISFPIGKMSDKYGRKRIILLGALISMIAIILSPYTTNITYLSIIFFFIGFGFTAINNAASTIIADITHPNERGKTMALFLIASNTGPTIFPALSSIIFASLGFIYIGWLGAVIMLFILLLIVPLKEIGPGVYDNFGARPEDIPC